MRRVACLAVLILSLALEAHGALAVSLHPDAMRGRTHALRGVLVEFTYDGTAVLRGHLRVVMKEGRATRGIYVSDELALTAGTTTFRLFLPATHGYGGIGSESEAELFFETERKRHKLGRQPFLLPDANVRQLLVGTTRMAIEADDPAAGLFQALRLENYDPERSQRRFGGLRTMPIPISPKRVPRQALEYTAYDLVVMEGPTFEGMRERELDALVGWLRAGGSAYLRVPRQPAPAQAAFFETIGATAAPACSHAAPLRLRLGLGRVVLVPDRAPPEGHFETPAWRATLAFLWKLRAAQAPILVDTGTWAVDQEITEQDFGNNWMLRQAVQSRLRGQRGRLTLTPFSRSDLTGFFAGLIPVDFQPVPTWILAAVLIGFVLVIGPIDYFVLGAFRARRFTWLTFPAACLVCAGLIAVAANRYLASGRDLYSATVVDVAPDGSVAREHRIDLTVSSRSGTLTRDYTECLYAPLSGTAWGYGQFTVAETDAERTVYRGAVPGRYALDTHVAKWSPGLARRLYFGRAPDATYTVPRLPDPPRFKTDGQWQVRAHDQFIERNGEGLELWLLRGSQRIMVVGSSQVARQGWGTYGYMYGHQEGGPAGMMGPMRVGFASIVSQVSPTCDPNLDDFGLYDDSDPESVLWVVRDTTSREPTIMRMLQRLEKSDGTG